jgi:hypothetical protein
MNRGWTIVDREYMDLRIENESLNEQEMGDGWSLVDCLGLGIMIMGKCGWNRVGQNGG